MNDEYCELCGREIDEDAGEQVYVCCECNRVICYDCNYQHVTDQFDTWPLCSDCQFPQHVRAMDLRDALGL